MPYDWLDEISGEVPALVASAMAGVGEFDTEALVGLYDLEFNPDKGHSSCSVWLFNTVKTAGHDHSWDPYRPKGWCRFSSPVVFEEGEKVGFGDIVVFDIGDGLLLPGVCIGEDTTKYHIISAMPGDKAGFNQKPKGDLKFARRNPENKAKGEVIDLPVLTASGDLKV